MGGRRSKTSVSDRVSTHRAPTTHPHNASSSPSSSPPQNVLQPTQQTSQSENITSTPDSDRTSAFGLDESDTHRASISPLLHPKRNSKASQEILHKKHARSSPASIMTRLHGVPVYSHGNPADPVMSSAQSTTELQRILSQDGTAAPCKILLPKLDPTLRYNPSAYWRSTLAKPFTPSAQRRPDNTPQDPPHFAPHKCHWRALRDVAFVLDGGMELSEEDLCALLRFRYAKDDPLMARVETCHIGAMYEFCKGLQKEMYERTAWGLIRLQMGTDLKLMREGGVALVSGDF